MGNFNGYLSLDCVCKHSFCQAIFEVKVKVFKEKCNSSDYSFIVLWFIFKYFIRIDSVNFADARMINEKKKTRILSSHSWDAWNHYLLVWEFSWTSLAYCEYRSLFSGCRIDFLWLFQQRRDTFHLLHQWTSFYYFCISIYLYHLWLFHWHSLPK